MRQIEIPRNSQKWYRFVGLTSFQIQIHSDRKHVYRNIVIFNLHIVSSTRLKKKKKWKTSKLVTEHTTLNFHDTRYSTKSITLLHLTYSYSYSLAMHITSTNNRKRKKIIIIVVSVAASTSNIMNKHNFFSFCTFTLDKMQSFTEKSSSSKKKKIIVKQNRWHQRKCYPFECEQNLSSFHLLFTHFAYCLHKSGIKIHIESTHAKCINRNQMSKNKKKCLFKINWKIQFLTGH